MTFAKPLFFAKVFYFFYYAAWACLLPFLGLYYQSLGYEGGQIGLLTSITPLTILFAAPMWAGLADTTRRHKAILLGTIAGAAAAALVLSWVSSFWALALVILFYAFFSAPIIPIIDSSVLALLGDQPDRYGSQRVWGAIGWGAAGPLAGWLTGQYGLHLSFYSFIALAAVALLAATCLPIHSAPNATPFWKGMGRLLADRRWILFLLVVFLSGSGLSVVHGFLFLYLDQLGASNSLMGSTLTIATLSEIPVLFFSGQMLRRWGTRGLMLLSLSAYLIRAFGYALAPGPELVLLLQLTHGLTFSAMLVAGVSFAAQMAPPGLSATAQGVFSSTMMGLAGITGSLAGGVLYQAFGGRGVFTGSGIAVLVGLLLFLMVGKRRTADEASPL